MSPEEITRSHRWHAVECNNLAWDLSVKSARTTSEDAEMLHAAHASAFHWARCGTKIHQVRAQMLLARVHAVLGQGEPARNYALPMLDYLTTHDTPDWELAMAHAIVAHAACAAGDAPRYREHHAQARQLGEAITDAEDKAVFYETFQTIPAPHESDA